MAVRTLEGMKFSGLLLFVVVVVVLFFCLPFLFFSHVDRSLLEWRTSQFAIDDPDCRRLHGLERLVSCELFDHINEKSKLSLFEAEDEEKMPETKRKLP
jgi:hypothetical protein